MGMRVISVGMMEMRVIRDGTRGIGVGMQGI